MMVEMARQPPNLHHLLNEGIAFIIDTFKHQIPQCPLGRRPVMIGRRKPAYDTVDKDDQPWCSLTPQYSDGQWGNCGEFLTLFRLCRLGT